MKPVLSQILKPIAVYLAIMAALNLIWEIAHLPLYTIWLEEDFASKAFAVLHCTVGDLLIALTSLGLAIFVFGRKWTRTNYWQVASLSIVLGMVYTVFSEWMNISVRGTWAYRDIMPVVPPFDTGLTPLLQWLVLPALTFGILYSRGPYSRRNAARAILKGDTE